MIMANVRLSKNYKGRAAGTLLVGLFLLPHELLSLNLSLNIQTLCICRLDITHPSLMDSPPLLLDKPAIHNTSNCYTHFLYTHK